MSEAKFIDRSKPLSPGLDYAALRQRGLEIVQQLAGGSWTDYNEHDPGVTTLELLCYALTELSYRAELPIEDLLVDPDTGEIDAERQRLFPPEAILPCDPLTENDYRKVIVDRVPSVANAWLRPHDWSEPGGVGGLYDIDLYVPAADAAEQDVVEQVRRAYAGVRALCEDLHSVTVLQPVPARLTAKVSIDSSTSIDSVTARILYQVAVLLAPELRRQGLEAMLAEGRTPASILVGPLPAHGFVNDDDLEPRRDRFTIGEITGVLRQVPGVIAVHGVRVQTAGASMDTAGGASAIAVPRGGILKLDTASADACAGIRLVQHDVECRPRPEAVMRELARLWGDHRREYDTQAECARLLSFPTGSAVDLAAYELFQLQFPAVYGVNQHGVPSDATDTRRAQASQLKAFLLVFEQLLADGFARLASTARGASHEAVYQRLDVLFPELRPLLLKGYREGVRTMETRGRAADRLWRARRQLLAIYGETAEPVVAAAPRAPAGNEVNDDVARARAQVDLLRCLPRIGMRRGTGFDYAAPPAPHNVCGMEERTRLQLGLGPDTPPPIDHTLRRFGLAELSDAPPVAHRALMVQHARLIDRQFTPLPELVGRADPAPDPQLSELSEELLIAAASAEHYRIGTLPHETATWMVVCRAPSQPLWQLAGMFDDEPSARRGALAVLRAARAIHRQTRRLYIVEHSLLRFAPDDRDDTFEASFTVSAVVSAPAREALDPEYRANVCGILRSNTPAHVVVRGCFLRFGRLRDFETLYWSWRDSLQNGQGREDACRRLRDFLRPEVP